MIKRERENTQFHQYFDGGYFSSHLREKTNYRGKHAIKKTKAEFEKKIRVSE
jgi:hypothetical protein